MSCYKRGESLVNTYKVWQSVARPEMPIKHLSFTLKTLWKLASIVISWVDSLVSDAIATQLWPDMASIELPLYWSWSQMSSKEETYH